MTLMKKKLKKSVVGGLKLNIDQKNIIEIEWIETDKRQHSFDTFSMAFVQERCQGDGSTSNFAIETSIESVQLLSGTSFSSPESNLEA